MIGRSGIPSRRTSGKRFWGAVTALALAGSMLAGCAAILQKPDDLANRSCADGGSSLEERLEIQVFVAASLESVMQELAGRFLLEHPEIKITFNADSSGKLLTQILEGYECDIFFPAAQVQMDRLEEAGLMEPGSRVDVVQNQVAVVSYRGSKTEVTGLLDLWKAESIALAGGSVPVGRYARQALRTLGILAGDGDVADISAKQVSESLGGVEISEQDNVSKTLASVVEASCEVGIVYYSDTYGYKDKLDVLQVVEAGLTGEVSYPIAQVKNEEALDGQKEAAAEFISYLLSEEAKDIFQDYYFGTGNNN